MGAKSLRVGVYLDLTRHYGREVAFRIAHEADPKAQLYYNDYGLSSSVKRGVRDGDSWKNDFPIRGRRDYPLLFDREGKMKSAWRHCR